MRFAAFQYLASGPASAGRGFPPPASQPASLCSESRGPSSCVSPPPPPLLLLVCSGISRAHMGVFRTILQRPTRDQGSRPRGQVDCARRRAGEDGLPLALSRRSFPSPISQILRSRATLHTDGEGGQRSRGVASSHDPPHLAVGLVSGAGSLGSWIRAAQSAPPGSPSAIIQYDAAVQTLWGTLLPRSLPLRSVSPDRLRAGWRHQQALHSVAAAALSRPLCFAITGTPAGFSPRNWANMAIHAWAPAMERFGSAEYPIPDLQAG